MDERLQKLEERMNIHTHNGVDNTYLLPNYGFVTYSLPSTSAATSTNYGVIFTATRPGFIRGISESHTVAGTSPSLQVERLTSGVALGAGTTLLVTALDLSSTANIPQYRGLRAGSPLVDRAAFRKGDRLALKISGTLTNLEGLNITLELQY